jgi:gas vesicle protein
VIQITKIQFDCILLRRKIMSRLFSFLFGALLGGLVGSSLVLLLTPESGENLRQRMRANAENIQQEVRQAAAAKRTELEQQLDTLRIPRPSKPA